MDLGKSLFPISCKTFPFSFVFCHKGLFWSMFVLVWTREMSGKIMTAVDIV